MFVKPVLWLGDSRSDVRSFPADVQHRVGYQLWLVQQGLPPDDWRAMGTVGPGVAEIRVRTGQEHRVFYIAKFEEGVYVLHAFEKKTQQTRKADLELARRRLRELIVARGKRER
jgi:phage-related protein